MYLSSALFSVYEFIHFCISYRVFCCRREWGGKVKGEMFIYGVRSVRLLSLVLNRAVTLHIKHGDSNLILHKYYFDTFSNACIVSIKSSTKAYTPPNKRKCLYCHFSFLSNIPSKIIRTFCYAFAYHSFLLCLCLPRARCCCFFMP